MIVQARKPDFFNYNMSLYEVVTDDGLMRPVMKARKVRQLKIPVRSVMLHPVSGHAKGV